MGCIQSSSKSVHSPSVSSPPAQTNNASSVTSQEYSHGLYGRRSDFDNLGSIIDLRTLQQEVISLFNQIQVLPAETQSTLQPVQANLEQLSADLNRRTQHFEGESSAEFRQRLVSIRHEFEFLMSHQNESIC